MAAATTSPCWSFDRRPGRGEHRGAIPAGPPIAAAAPSGYPRAVTSRPSPPHALQRIGPDQALRDAIARQEALTAKVDRARAQLIALDAEVRETMAAVVEGSQAKLREIAALDRAIHELFVTLVTDPKRRVNIRRQIAELHHDLTGNVLSVEGFEAAMSPPPTGGRPGPDGHAPDAPFDPLDDELADDAPDVPSAAPGDGSLRALFRRLAENLHPDKVQDDADKAARTEVMKEVTSAYRAGDVARLLELERTWATQREVPTADEHARRLTLIAAAIDDLEDQLRTINRAKRALRASPGGMLLRQLGPRRGRPARIAAMGREVDDNLADLQRIHAHVVAFRDGRISLDALLDGPPPSAAEVAAMAAEEAELFAALDALAELVAAAPPRRGKAPRRRRR